MLSSAVCPDSSSWPVTSTTDCHCFSNTPTLGSNFKQKWIFCLPSVENFINTYCQPLSVPRMVWFTNICRTWPQWILPLTKISLGIWKSCNEGHQNMIHSYSLSHEYQVVRNLYSWLLFTSEDGHQFACARIIDKYDVTMSVPRICVMSQISCGDITTLSRKRPSLATMARWAIHNCF